MKQSKKIISWLLIGAFLLSPLTSYAQVTVNVPTEAVLRQGEMLGGASPASKGGTEQSVALAVLMQEQINELSNQLQRIADALPQSPEREKQMNVFLRMAKSMFVSLLEGIKVTAQQVGKSLVTPTFWIDLIRLAPLIIILVLAIMYRKPLMQGGRAAKASIRNLQNSINSLSETVGHAQSMVTKLPGKARDVVVEGGRVVAEVPLQAFQEIQRELKVEEMPFETLDPLQKEKRIEKEKISFQLDKPAAQQRLEKLGLRGRLDPMTGITTITPLPEPVPIVEKKAEPLGAALPGIQQMRAQEAAFAAQQEQERQEAEVRSAQAEADRQRERAFFEGLSFEPVSGGLTSAVESKPAQTSQPSIETEQDPFAGVSFKGGALSGVGRSKQRPTQTIPGFFSPN